jgi:lipopolysaccharide biosynthesis regulator YciM
MKKSNRINQEDINDFLKQVEENETNKQDLVHQEEVPQIKKYRCPKCNSKLASRNEQCPSCHYKGYIPMSDDETKKTKTILFFILLVIALAVIIWKQFA